MWKAFIELEELGWVRPQAAENDCGGNRRGVRPSRAHFPAAKK